MSEETYIPFRDLVNELEQLCSAQKTGVFFIATKANRSAQLMMEDGKIVFIYFFNKRGRDGLKLMTQIKAGRFRFQEGPINAKPMDLPPTPEIIDFLRSAASGTEAEGIADTVEAPSLKKTDEPTASSAGAGLTPDQKDKLEDLLAVYIGPMAAIICEDHLDTAPDLNTAIEALASEVPSADQAASFRNEAQKKLG
ncbi:DUF4388 domain-containing protein [Desulfopila sp. IMCC35008]|uniref:DUF4388 domain-containing protein n=1 Tax=Desulfopila sp. IMCC35008 TaxID=2653858 RepID=UPI0013D5ECA2|nr:DUF4388 domain-containing protein [Desulfopila sp. IMCC35008]